MEGQPTKQCPQCAEDVKAEARICRYCRYEFIPGAAHEGAGNQPTGWETLEVYDHDTGNQIHAWSEDVRHFLVLRHTWPGGLEETPILEWKVSYHITLDQVTERGSVQNALAEIAGIFQQDGWERMSSGAWYTLSFRRPLPADGVVSRRATQADHAAMESIRKTGKVPKGFWDS